AVPVLFKAQRAWGNPEIVCQQFAEDAAGDDKPVLQIGELKPRRALLLVVGQQRSQALQLAWIHGQLGAPDVNFPRAEPKVARRQMPFSVRLDGYVAHVLDGGFGIDFMERHELCWAAGPNAGID